MKINKIAINIPIFLLLLVWIVVVIKYNRHTSGLEATYQQFVADTVQHYETIILEDKSTLSIQSGQIGELQQALEAGLITQELLKQANIDKVQTIVSLKSQIKLQNQLLEYQTFDTIHDTIHVDQGIYLKVPQLFHRENQWFNVHGRVLSNGVFLDSLNIFQDLSIVVGYQNVGFFKQATPVVAYHDNNPYVIPTEMQNITIENKPWYYSPWRYRAEGFLGALVIKGIVELLN